MDDRYWAHLEAQMRKGKYGEAEQALIRRAYEVAARAHEGQKRASGEPYISHCVAVAEILMDMHMPAEVVAAGLLHDTLEDTALTYEDLEREFGADVANLVKGVTKLTALPRVSRLDQAQSGANGGEPASSRDATPAPGADNGRESGPGESPGASPSPGEKKRAHARRQELTLENLRKTFLAMWEDIRVVPVKLADRLHNMRTLWHLPPHKRKRIAQETLTVFAPLAHRLGIERIRRELEDLAFKYVDEHAYDAIVTRLDELDSRREQDIARAVERVRQALEEAGIRATVKGRPKHVYSVYRKLLKKGWHPASQEAPPVDEIYDVRGVRIIIPQETPDLEAVLDELVPELSRAALEREKDAEARAEKQQRRDRVLQLAREILERLKNARGRKLQTRVKEEYEKRSDDPLVKHALRVALEWFRRDDEARRKAVATCYSALGVVHTHWTPIPGEFDDYIARPKPSGYQSLHTTVIFDDGKPLEVQIRTSEMHEVAEFGVAAHWAYKEGFKFSDQDLQQKVAWFRSLLEWRQDVRDAQEFMESVQTDVFEDRVYVFTPKGDIIDLPKGATPIDFAYHIHTEIGHRCRGAKVNGQWVPLNYELKTGDIVEIITGKRGGPSRDWLNPELGLVKTQRARSKIRRWFRQQDRNQNLMQGREMLEREFQRLGLNDVDMDELVRRFGFAREDDLYVAIGCGDLSLKRIVHYLNERYGNTLAEGLVTRRTPRRKQGTESPVTVMGAAGLYTRFGRCCNPVPGDDIVGYITQGRGVTVHRKQCPNFLALQLRHPERVIEVHWGTSDTVFSVPVFVRAFDRQGLMRDISDVIAKEGINIRKAYVETEELMANIHLVLEVKDLAQLHRLLVRIENLPTVVSAQRAASRPMTAPKET